MKGERRMKLSRGIFEGDFVLWSCEMFLVGRRKILMVIEVFLGVILSGDLRKLIFYGRFNVC